MQVVTQSQSIAKLAGALSKAQAKITSAKKDSENPFFHASYADLSAVWTACRGPLTENELCVIQTMNEDEKGTFVVTTLAHSSGEFIQGALYITPKNKDSQSIGSAITYARRYSLAAIVGVAPDDDDGEAAVGRTPVKTNVPAQSKAPTPKLITREQANDLYHKAKEKGIKADLLLTYLKVKGLGELPLDKLDQANTWIASFKSTPSKEEIEKAYLAETDLFLKAGVNLHDLGDYVEGLPFAKDIPAVTSHLAGLRETYKGIDLVNVIRAHAKMGAKA